MTMPSTARPSALPDAWIDRLFMRFAVLYGKHWLDMWAGIPMEQVKAAWASELASVPAERFGPALQAVGKFPPTLPEFVALCKPQPPIPSPAYHRALLPSQKGAPPSAEVQREIDTLLAGWGGRSDPKKWAREILAEAKAGRYRYAYGIECATEALLNEMPADPEAALERQAIQDEAA